MGVSMNLHYCHGEVDSVSFFTEEGNCGCHGGEEPTHCCFDQSYKYEIGSEQVFSSIINFNFELIKVIPSVFYSNSFIDNTTLLSQNKSSHSPPLLSIGEPPIRILQSVFRI